MQQENQQDPADNSCSYSQACSEPAHRLLPTQIVLMIALIVRYRSISKRMLSTVLTHVWNDGVVTDHTVRAHQCDALSEGSVAGIAPINVAQRTSRPRRVSVLPAYVIIRHQMVWA